jgi:gliding motility-associated-like protein
MKKPYTTLYKLAILIGIIAISKPTEAQVSTRDSVALVSLYNSTGGAQWNTSTNWLTANNVGTWYGVKVAGGRVTKLLLAGNNLTGAATDSLSHLDSLKRVDLSGNKLTSFPALPGHLDSLSLQNNKLTFKDLIPNRAHVDSFYFAPQDSVDAYLDTLVTEQNSFLLKTMIDYNPIIDDNYNWYKGTTSLVSGPANTYNIPCMDSTKAGVYYCAITNLQLNGLTLYKRATNLRIKRLADPGSDFHVCASNSTLQGIQPAGDSVIWSRLTGTAAITNTRNATTAVSNLSVGANVFKYSVKANNVSCVAYPYSVALLTVTRDTNPSPANAGLDQSACSPQALLHADSPSVGIGTWTVTRGAATVAQPNSPATAVNGLVSGQNIFRWQIVNGACAPSFFDEVIIFRDDTLRSVSAGRDTSICPTSYVLNAPLPANTSWAWSVATGSGTFAQNSSTQTFLNDTNIVTPVSGLSELLNTFTWTVSNSCNTKSANVNVTVYRFTVANAGPDQTVFYSPINKYTLGDTTPVGTGGNGTYSYVWSPASDLDSDNVQHPKFLTPDSGYYTYSVTVTDGHGCTASDEVNYTVIKKAVLDVPTLFTPNGDGVNDVFYIPGVESYPNNELIVADRNDQVVYRKAGYKNDWGGINELGFSQQGQKLPADTYFYTLKLEDGRSLQTGFFLIKY